LPKFIVFAGPNGCGKSTLFHTNKDVFDIPRINVDEIVRENGGDWRNSVDLMHAGRLALKRLNSCMEKLESFNQETTLCGSSALRNIQQAHNLGYEVELYFVCVENVELAKARIRKRVAAGGHGIPDADVERRYTESLQKLKDAIPLCQKVELYDNTEKFRKIATLKNGRVSYLADDIPEWAKTLI
jgi:predicted ABC-type ATPase